MSEGNKKCWSCENFWAYYVRGYCALYKETTGMCHLHNKIMAKSDSCDKWHCRRTSKEKRTKIAINAIPDIYHKVAVLEQLLKEEIELMQIKKENE